MTKNSCPSSDSIMRGIYTAAASASSTASCVERLFIYGFIIQPSESTISSDISVVASAIAVFMLPVRP